MSQNIVIINYGMGNLFSIQKKINFLGANAIISSDYEAIRKADKLILPGVGHFGKAIENLKSLGLLDLLNEEVLINKKPVLGICLGMQLMASSSEEGDVKGLGWIEGKIVRFKISDKLKFKVPHIGWNSVSTEKNSKLMNQIPNNAAFYFVHSYHFESETSENILSYTDYEYKFASAIEKENIFGVQYHPEKSHHIGQLLLKNFLNVSTQSYTSSLIEGGRSC